MTSTELREARRKLGLSTAKLAEALRLGTGGGRTVRRWEKGDAKLGIPGPVQVAIELMVAQAVAKRTAG